MVLEMLLLEVQDELEVIYMEVEDEVVLHQVEDEVVHRQEVTVEQDELQQVHEVLQ